MEFNSINFNTNNFAANKANLVQNQPNLQNQNQNQSPILNSSQNQTQYINPSLMLDYQTIKMDNETVLKYLQNLMKLPNSIDKFVNQLNSKNIDPKLASILVENMISVKALSEFLNKNSNEAISKLMQTISQSLKSNIDTSQLKEILSILNVIQNTTATNANSIKELLLLYIPLNMPIFDKTIDGEIQSEEEKEVIKNSKLSILFETNNFSNLLITINELENSLLVDIYAANIFPKDEFLRITKALTKEASISTLIEFKEKQVLDLNNQNQNFKIISDGYISPNSLILAHLIIKTILVIDN